MSKIKMFFVAVSLFFGLSGAASAASYPSQDGYVTDDANALDARSKAHLEDYIQEVERYLGVRFSVVVIRSRDGESSKVWVSGLRNAWGFGTSATHIVIMHATGDRKWRISVGNKAMALISDDEAAAIGQGTLIEFFQSGEFVNGYGETIEKLARRIHPEGDVPRWQPLEDVSDVSKGDVPQWQPSEDVSDVSNGQSGISDFLQMIRDLIVSWVTAALAVIVAIFGLGMHFLRKRKNKREYYRNVTPMRQEIFRIKKTVLGRDTRNDPPNFVKKFDEYEKGYKSALAAFDDAVDDGMQGLDDDEPEKVEVALKTAAKKLEEVRRFAEKMANFEQEIKDFYAAAQSAVTTCDTRHSEILASHAALVEEGYELSGSEESLAALRADIDVLQKLAKSYECGAKDDKSEEVAQHAKEILDALEEVKQYMSDVEVAVADVIVSHGKFASVYDGFVTLSTDAQKASYHADSFSESGAFDAHKVALEKRVAEVKSLSTLEEIADLKGDLLVIGREISAESGKVESLTKLRKENAGTLASLRKRLDAVIAQLLDSEGVSGRERIRFSLVGHAQATILTDLDKAVRSAGNLHKRLDSAENDNSMRVQKFSQAKSDLGEVANHIGAIEKILSEVEVIIGQVAAIIQGYPQVYRGLEVLVGQAHRDCRRSDVSYSSMQKAQAAGAKLDDLPRDLDQVNDRINWFDLKEQCDAVKSAAESASAQSDADIQEAEEERAAELRRLAQAEQDRLDAIREAEEARERSRLAEIRAREDREDANRRQAAAIATSAYSSRDDDDDDDDNSPDESTPDNDGGADGSY